METIQEMADRLKLERWRKGCRDGHRTGKGFKSGEIHSVLAPGSIPGDAPVSRHYREGWNHGFAMALRGDVLPAEVES
jgi:hypothetical protein